MSYRCDACGNKTRFDIFETKRVRAFHHYSLGGKLEVEEEEVLDSNLEKVVCRWCGSSDSIKREAGSAEPQEQQDSASEPAG
jgi:DNA-directed RNA polymerase subunit RPC12/RpoP